MATWCCSRLAVMDGSASFHSKIAKTWNLYFGTDFFKFYDLYNLK